jgi:hypothetical protein
MDFSILYSASVGAVMKRNLGLLFLIASLQPAVAHHLDDFDARIRAEASLPQEWFACKSSEDCALVSVPCQSDLAVNTAYRDEAREALINAFPFCLGASTSDTEASCSKRQCVTSPSKKE